jgi:hypothetical protein
MLFEFRCVSISATANNVVISVPSTTRRSRKSRKSRKT